MILVIGEILFDRFPNYKRIGGAPFNFCFHLMQLGLPVRFISRVGMDEDGREIIEYLKKHNFPTKDIQFDPHHRTGFVRVELSPEGSPTFDIVPDVAYDYISYDALEDPPAPLSLDMVYFGSVIQRTEAAQQALHQFISDQCPNAIKFFDINLRPRCINKEAVLSSLEMVDLLKLNEEELEYLKKIKGLNRISEQFITDLLEEYNLKMLALTLGGQGSNLYTPQESLSHRPEKIQNLADTVGAGDAYASFMAFGYVKGWTNREIIQRATDFATMICQIEGAVPDSRNFYQPFTTEL